jgi:hypothetical protein
MSELLTRMDGNPKVAKNIKLGWGTSALHLAPAGMSGYQVCRDRSRGCETACLHFAGNPMYMDRKTTSRIRKTKMFFEQRDVFVDQLRKELQAHIRRCERKELKAAVRLNATSDLPWERIRFGAAPNIMSAFPTVKFYDYTKTLNRTNLPSNYHLTFSLSESNDDEAKQALAKGWNVAVVFPEGEVPETFWGYPVIDGDETDFRPADPTPCIVGLKVKGKLGKADTTGFIRRAE